VAATPFSRESANLAAAIRTTLQAHSGRFMHCLWPEQSWCHSGTMRAMTVPWFSTTLGSSTVGVSSTASGSGSVTEIGELAGCRQRSRNCKRSPFPSGKRFQARQRQPGTPVVGSPLRASADSDEAEDRGKERNACERRPRKCSFSSRSVTSTTCRPLQLRSPKRRSAV